MCGRFTLTTPAAALAEIFDLAELPELTPRYNIAPTQPVAVVRARAEGGRRLDMLRWGLIPGWAKEPGKGPPLINARADTVAEKPAFRSAFKLRRCLLPADGFFEWRTVDGKKMPVHFKLANGEPFAFAGLWEHWQGPDGRVIESCSLLTTSPNDVVAPVHDRMPVILPREAHAMWLDPALRDPAALQPLLGPYTACAMEAHAVSPRLNSPANDDPELLRPLD